MVESLEVRALRSLAAHIAARVTSTTGGDHSATSWHYAAGTDGTGLAVDLAELSGPSALTPGLKRIATEVARLIGPQCQELIYAAGPCLRGGKPYQYSATVLAAHRNHIHVAVRRGFRFAAPAATTEVRPMYDPPIAIHGRVVATLAAPSGGVWMLTEWGAVYAWNATDYGAPNRHPEYWNIPGQLAARLEPLGAGYRVIDNAGRPYDYPAS